MFKPKVKLNKELMDKCTKAAKLMGCCSVDEFIAGILERETETILAKETTSEIPEDRTADIKRKLQGLGYMD
ncbi:MAG: hypothetical protein RBU23_03095 [Candidatus Auribacterota bacterium]|jgi:hypothetical protein|nr:hypothetical protein [Candidatus Auribacterota bacterium]